MDVIEYSVPPKADKNDFDEPIRSLHLSEVVFAYNSESKPVLDNFNVSFEYGRVNTVIGRSGAGKTTFINLCMGLRKPTSGSIFYNRKNVDSFTDDVLAKKIGLVEQEPFVFSGTLAENIFFDSDGDSDYALQLIKDFDLSYLAGTEAELKKLRIWKNGRKLSTGEKQRIALIRALIRKVDVIFFDEVTGSLSFCMLWFRY